jgi:hypothetical protein
MQLLKKPLKGIIMKIADSPIDSKLGIIEE